MADPKQLGKYDILETLGKGAMGVVYKGYDPRIERLVAIKTIRMDVIDSDPGALAMRFRNEAKAAGRLNHPGIVQVYDYGEDADMAYIAMEFVEGHGLRDYLVHGAGLPAHDVLSIMVQLLEALDYAHKCGVVHRDIKPANIILMGNGRLKIADFGIARVDASNLTMDGSVLGTPSYMAPEQFMGKACDRRVDLFAAGVLFYELITGSKPFVGTAEAVAYKICYEPAAPPTTLAKGLPVGVDPIVEKALAKQPDDRFQTAHQFSSAIQTVFESPPAPSVSEETIKTVTLAKALRHEATTSHSVKAVGGTRTGAPPGWQDETLKTVERRLAAYVGPLARVLVKKAACETTDIGELYRALSRHLPSDGEKTAFLLAGGTRTIVKPGAAAVAAHHANAQSVPVGRESDAPLTPEQIDEAAHRLAVFVGPIAKVLVKKSAQKSAGARSLYVALADNIPDEAQRRRFLREAGISEH